MAKTYNLGLLENLPLGKFQIVELDGAEIGILRLASGEVHAVRNVCPHKTAPICKGILGGTWPPSDPGKLEFDRDGEILVCPRHGWEFDVKSGEEMYQRLPARLRKYAVSVVSGEVLLTV
jgi:nitrite reductase (NADH) small subunit